MKTRHVRTRFFVALLGGALPLGFAACDGDWPSSEIDQAAEEMGETATDLQEDIAADWDAVPADPRAGTAAEGRSLDTDEERSQLIAELSARMDGLVADLDDTGERIDPDVKSLTAEWRELKQNADEALRRLREAEPTGFDSAASRAERAVEELKRKTRDLKARLDEDA